MEKEKKEQILTRIGEKDYYSGLTGIRYIDVDDGYCSAELIIEKKNTNPLGTVHGGCLYTMADTCGGIAAATLGNAGPTISGDMFFTGPTIGFEKLICEARVVKNGKRIRVVEAEIVTEKGTSVARAMLQYMDVQKKITV